MNLICNKWFPDSERTLVTALCGLSIPAGNIFAFTMSGILFAGLDPDIKSDYPQIIAAEDKLILIQCLWITSVSVPLFFIIREKPKYPPSLVAMQERKETNFMKSLKEAL